MNVLHITSWYPTCEKPYETPFIKAHFDALDGNIRQELWHIQVQDDDNFRLSFGRIGQCEHYITLCSRVSVWRIKELFTLFLLLFVRLKLGNRWWNVVNVHVAYPLLRFPRLFRWMFGKNIVISEHWSAYHYGFYLPEGNRARRRIENIFHHHIPVVAVSQALMNDIVRFNGTDNFPRYVIPNVVDPSMFNPSPRQRSKVGLVFLMVGSWAPIKLPLLAMAAFADIAAIFSGVYLRIIGAGSQFQAMQDFIVGRGLQSQVSLLGPMTKAEIAKEMRRANCFLHPSSYETFSVVCAEALCCGLPVIASDVGGIPEFVNDNNGILVKNDLDAWTRALTRFISEGTKHDPERIASNAADRFNPNVVAEQLAAAYRETIFRR